MKSFEISWNEIILVLVKLYYILWNPWWNCIIQKTKHMCVYMHHIHIHAPPNTHVHHQIPSKYKIYLVGPSLRTLWNTRSKWEICVESVVFVAFQVFFMKSAMLFSEKCRFSWKAQCFSLKSATFHEMHNERPFARNCNPMFNIFVSKIRNDVTCCTVGKPTTPNLFQKPSSVELIISGQHVRPQRV